MVLLAGQLPAEASIVSQRLCDLLMQFPSVATDGVRWRVLVRKYEERYSCTLNFSKFGHDTALTAATMLLWDVLRVVDGRDSADPLLAIEDGVALTAQPGRMGSWPSLYQTLSEIVQSHGSEEEVDGALVHNLLLSQVKPLLQSKWHANFEESGLGFLKQDGSFTKLKKLKHVLVAVLQWRNQRVASRETNHCDRTSVDKALLPELVLVPSTTHNDLVVKRLIPASGGHAFCGTIAQQGQQYGRTKRNDTKLGRMKGIVEVERSRDEGANLGVDGHENSQRCDDEHFARSVADEVPDLFDDPFEPPPEKTRSILDCSFHPFAVPVGIVQRYRLQILSVAGPNPAPPPLWPRRELESRPLWPLH